jgi:hypothetical protein
LRNGKGKVLVIDGGGSLRCALVGDQLAILAKKNGWEGVVVYGCIRDSGDINGIDIGVRALNTHPQKSIKKGVGDRDIRRHLRRRHLQSRRRPAEQRQRSALPGLFPVSGVQKHAAVTTNPYIAPMFATIAPAR